MVQEIVKLSIFHNIELKLTVQRYICKDCKKTFSPSTSIANVKYICIDIYSPYISLVKSIFPESEIVLDKFHIVNLVSRAFNQTRISIMNSLKDDSLKRKLKLF